MAVSKTSRYHAKLLQKFGPEDDFETMAGLFMAYVTAVYGLIDQAKLQKGETVLIHSATGGVGMAAIQIAQGIGAEIFATVGSPEKREFLKTHYGFDDTHILNSRDMSFAEGVMAATNGRGVDVSLNYLIREPLRATWNCIANYGRHIELGQTDIFDQGWLDMTPFARNASFIAVDLVLVAQTRPEIIERQVSHPEKTPGALLISKFSLLERVLKMYHAGTIKPIAKLSIFPASEVIRAFIRFGEQDRIGKIVVSFDQTTELIVSK